MNNVVNTSFDLEQAIMSAWNVTDDLSLIADKLESGKLNNDEAVSLLRAVKQMQQLRFEKAFDLFELVHRELCVAKNTSVGNVL